MEPNLVNFPNIPLPDLDYDSMSPLDKALLLLLFGQLCQLQIDFRRVWDSIPYSFELNRFRIDRIGRYFAILEAGMVRLRILPQMGILHGVMVSDLLARVRHKDPPSIRLTENDDLAIVKTLHLGNNTPVFIEAPVTALRLCLESFVTEITDFRAQVRQNMSRMLSFVKMTYTVSRVIGATPQRYLISRTTTDKLVFGCIEQVTYLRIQIDKVIVNGQRCIAFQINPAWGVTAMAWEASDLYPPAWDPRSSQVPWENQNVGRNFNVYCWNIMGVENPAFEECLRFIKERFDPRMIVFTETINEAKYVYRIMAILEWSGWWINERDGGIWIVWDSKALNVRFRQAADDGAHMVLSLRARA